MERNSIIARMFSRRLLPQLIDELHHFPAVALLGPRQVGKTTLALEIAKALPEGSSIYLDMESKRDRAKLDQPERFCRINQFLSKNGVDFIEQFLLEIA